jgi:hypothetical protein
MVAACSGRKIGPRPTAAPTSADGSIYGGSFPLLRPAGDDEDDATIPPPPSAVDDREERDTGSDASPEDVTVASLPDGACRSPLVAGALRIEELMIASVAGSGDNGEWLEVASTVDCAVNLSGLHGECPHGSSVTTFDVAGDLWVPPRGTFVVADSSDPAINHELPGVVVAWFGHPGDVLRNQGTTITLRLDETMIDTVTYPSLTPAVGNSIEFPADCDAGDRANFAHWKRSTASWFPGFFGTPNAPNTDVTCP